MKQRRWGMGIAPTRPSARSRGHVAGLDGHFQGIHGTGVAVAEFVQQVAGQLALAGAFLGAWVEPRQPI